MAMDEERLALIRGHAEQLSKLVRFDMPPGIYDLRHDVHMPPDIKIPGSTLVLGIDLLDLLAAYDAQRAVIEAVRPIIEAVAEAGVGDEYGGGTWLMFAGYDADTVRMRARALLDQHTAG